MARSKLKQRQRRWHRKQSERFRQMPRVEQISYRQSVEMLANALKDVDFSTMWGSGSR